MTDEIPLNKTPGCPPYPSNITKDATVKDKAGAVAEMLQAAKIQSCYSKSDTTSTMALAITPFGGGGANVVTNSTTSIGCENLVALGIKYKQTLHNITCVINKSIKNVTSNTVTINSVQISASDGAELNLDCGQSELKIKQGIKLDANYNFRLTDEDKSQITSEVKTLTDAAINAIQANKSELGSTEKGNKFLTNIESEMTSINYSQKVSEAIQNISMKVDSSNILKITAKGRGTKVNISANGCEIDQNILAKITASMILQNAFSTSVSGIIDIVNKFDADIEQKSEGRGVAQLVEAFTNMMTALGTGPLILIAIIIMAVIIGIVMLAKALLGGGLPGGSSDGSSGSGSLGTGLIDIQKFVK